MQYHRKFFVVAMQHSDGIVLGPVIFVAFRYCAKIYGPYFDCLIIHCLEGFVGSSAFVYSVQPKIGKRRNGNLLPDDQDTRFWMSDLAIWFIHGHIDYSIRPCKWQGTFSM